MSTPEERERESREGADDKFHEQREQKQEERGRLGEQVADGMSGEENRDEGS
jgi:hypothetical protein